MATTWLDEHLRDSEQLVVWLRDTERASGIVTSMAARLSSALAAGHRVISCGNGGSMSDAIHFAEELSGRFRHDRPAFAAQAISDPAHLTCVANDFGFDHVFARGVEAWGRSGDVLVALSTSGNSPNVIKAAESARARGMVVLGLLGRDGGALRVLCDESLVVPSQDSGRVQEIHIKVIHLMIEAVERTLVPENYQ
jgi:D-sedoheptulose 7-phosphate isomerase